MRLTAFIAGVLVSALIFVGNSEKAQALSPADMALNHSSSIVDELISAQTDAQEAEAEAETDEPAEEPKVIKHTVQKDETLIDVAKQYDTTWQRIFAKNEQLEHPDVIKPSDELVIPHADEELELREVPVIESRSEVVVSNQSSTTTANPQPVIARGSSGGNLYSYGYCTWYVKNRRPDLPNNLGNANTWVARARAQGIPTGSAPRVGAVGQQGMHVVYVESVNGDGTVTVSEMNFRGWNTVNRRTVSAGSFQYIY